MTATLLAYITNLDGPVFVGWVLIILMVSLAVACQIARHGQPEQSAPRLAASSNRKAARR